MDAASTLIWIKGAGDLATGVAYRLLMAGFPVVMTELPQPLCVRRTVSFAEAVATGRQTVEGFTAVLVGSPEEARLAASWGQVPVLIDPDGSAARTLNPVAVVDMILAKRNTGTSLTDAPIVIGVGPGFTAGADCHAVIETNRGHWLGRALYTGSAAPDTGIPGPVKGATSERVLRAPCDGTFRGLAAIGDVVELGQVVGEVQPADGGPAQPVVSTLAGLLRGLIRDGVRVRARLKVGDVDPTMEPERCNSVSDKALAVGGGVLEALLHFLVRRQAG